MFSLKHSRIDSHSSPCNYNGCGTLDTSKIVTWVIKRLGFTSSHYLDLKGYSVCVWKPFSAAILLNLWTVCRFHIGLKESSLSFFFFALVSLFSHQPWLMFLLKSQPQLTYCGSLYMIFAQNSITQLGMFGTYV